jgi:hypothetical protein
MLKPHLVDVRMRRYSKGCVKPADKVKAAHSDEPSEIVNRDVVLEMLGDIRASEMQSSAIDAAGRSFRLRITVAAEKRSKRMRPRSLRGGSLFFCASVGA